MEILETIMNENLQNQYKIKALLTLLDMINSSCDEDNDMVLKSFSTIFKTYLETLYRDMNTTIDKLDVFLMKNL